MKMSLVVVLAICAGFCSATVAQAGCLTGAVICGLADHVAGQHSYWHSGWPSHDGRAMRSLHACARP